MKNLTRLIKDRGFEYDGKRSNNIEEFAKNVLFITYRMLYYKVKNGALNHWEIKRIIDALGVKFEDLGDPVPPARVTEKSKEKKPGEAGTGKIDPEQLYNEARNKE